MFEEIPLSALIGTLVLFIVLSAFFSGSETGLFSLNRYRLKHLARHHSGAQRAQELLSRPDRLIGILLLCNTFVNIAASSLATVISLRLWGDAGVAIAAGILTLLLLIFGEVTPKTIAALYPERVAFAVSHVLWILLRVLAPLVRAINGITNGLLRLFGISPDKVAHQPLSGEELRTVVHEAGAVISAPHQRMLLSILDLEKATVEEIMVPRNDVVGIDLDQPWEDILDRLTTTQHTWLPVWQGDIDHVVGFVHTRHFLGLQHHGTPDKEDFREIVREAYFIPEGTPLHTQLLNFQQQRRRVGLVVDEYGDILGLVTLEDILEEIVGEFTTDPAQNTREVHPQSDGTFLVDCTITIRELNRAMGWQLPTEGPRTLNGMITEYLETLPVPGTSFLLAGHPIEVVQTGANAVKTVRINPAYRVERNARRQRAARM